MSKTYLITGANSGLGFDATRQLALRNDVQTVFMACRSEEKAQKAIDDLVQLGVSKTKLRFIPFDGSSSKSQIIQAVANSLPLGTVLDGIVLNAGGIGHDTVGRPTKPNHILPIVQINLAAHVHLVEYLRSQDHLKKNHSRIIYVGTEGSRGIPFIGMKSPDFVGDTPDYFKPYIDGSAYTTTNNNNNNSNKNKYDPMAVYPEAKGLATLYFSAWARQHPQYFVLTVSPGGTKGTSFAHQEAMNPMMSVIFPIMMKVFGAFGKFHSLKIGAKRYVDAVTGEGEFRHFLSGSFVASKKGVAGPVADQVEVFATAKQYGDVKKQDAVYAAMQEYL